jgi:hypothetical protein
MAGIGVKVLRPVSNESQDGWGHRGRSVGPDTWETAAARPLPSPRNGDHPPGILSTGDHWRTGNVRPAAYLTAAGVANSTMGAENRASSEARLVSISDTSGIGPTKLTYPVVEYGQIILVRSAGIKMLFAGLADGATLRVRRGDGKYLDFSSGNFVEGSHGGNLGATSTEKLDPDVTVTLEPEANKLIAFERGKNGKETEIATITVVAPAEQGVQSPQVSGVFNNSLDQGRAQAVPNNVRVYGKFLRVFGTFHQGDYDPGRSELVFLLAEEVGKGGDKTEDTLVSANEQPTVSRFDVQDDQWAATLTIPKKTAGFHGSLHAVHKKDSHIAFDNAQVINLTVARDAPFSPAPVIEDVLTGEGGSAGLSETQEGAKLITDASQDPSLVVGTRLGSDHNAKLMVYEVRNGRLVPTDHSPYEDDDNDGNWTAPISLSNHKDGVYPFQARIVQGDLESDLSEPVRIHLLATGPRIRSVDPANLLFGTGRIRLTVFFSPENPLESGAAETEAYYEIKKLDGTRAAVASSAILNGSQNSVTLNFADFDAEGEFTLFLDREHIVDVNGKKLERYDTIKLIKSTIAGTPTVAPGISHTTGPYVKYHEFTKPREPTTGFNPSDKVESRVARLYYFRDAHRVVQIINRKVKSYNRQGVDMARQLADKARQDAEARTRARQAAEREAIRKAQETREKERQLQAAEQELRQAANELNFAIRQPADQVDQSDVEALEDVIRSIARRADDLRSDVQQRRAEEAEATEAVSVAEAEEQAAVAEQFRREVAAAHADPDTFAPGVPDSYDPVEQVSVSVIGEGLIHLRGPLKGINVIRTMIDQIDSPMGQVRVSVHTCQINGERAERMEEVANVIQRYIDQARFLTLQSGEMLRRAVVQVAARKAEEARMMYPDDTQEARDQRYLHSFFGSDFINELRTIDSEFLRTGNKLLSLHSMDTTSLSSALTLLALAKNTTRQEIFAEFDGLLMSELPLAEARNLEAGMAGCTNTKRFRPKCREVPVYTLSENARFESLRAFFNAEIGHDDTMTPLQREFIRLAQILKSRLITELEYKQRVMERAIIEERIGDPVKEALAAKEKEDQAKKALADARASANLEKETVVSLFADLMARMRNLSDSMAKFQDTDGQSLYDLSQQLKRASSAKCDTNAAESEPITWKLGRQAFNFNLADGERLKLVERNGPEGARNGKEKVCQDFNNAYRDLVVRTRFLVVDEIGVYRFRELLYPFLNAKRRIYALDSKLKAKQTPVTEVEREDYCTLLICKDLIDDARPRFDDTIREFRSRADALLFALASMEPDVIQLFKNWKALEQDLMASFHNTEAPEIKKHIKTIEEVDRAFNAFFVAGFKVIRSRDEADRSRRPLDHKKFLDQLIDDLEEKYIELLEGTRAHTANIDNYLKRLTTALDDDFNTQFYHPTFRFVREASVHWDVHFGQTETTSILANNRQFAKVLPGATMEFDLPERDILLAEGINGAKALIDDVGALANDPTFLAAARLQSPSSTASPPAGSTGGQPVVRSVLPGLSTDTAEQVLSQNTGGRNQFGSNLENLIPDPAIYKFETGTGFEIRPVIQPDGQAVVFDFNYMYTTNVREPVRADEKHLGRVKRHFINTDVQLSNFELREVSRYQVALKASRTGRGVPLFENVPVVGVLFRPLPSQESSLQQNLIMGQATIFPTLFDLMGLRWAPCVADLDPLRLSNREFIVRSRRSFIKNRVYDEASSQVDEFLRIPDPLRRRDLYRTQETIPQMHPNGYVGAGLDYHDSELQEGHQPNRAQPQERFIPSRSKEGAPFLPHRRYERPQGTFIEEYPLEEVRPARPDPQPSREAEDPRPGPLNPAWGPPEPAPAPEPEQPLPPPLPMGNDFGRARRLTPVPRQHGSVRYAGALDTDARPVRRAALINPMSAPADPRSSRYFHR